MTRFEKKQIKDIELSNNSGKQMKIRMGFVSNSSSSSFVIALEEFPRSAKEIQKVLFGDRKNLMSSYEDRESEFTCEEAAQRVYSDIVSSKIPLTYEELLEECDDLGYDNKLYNSKKFQIKSESGKIEIDYAAIQEEINKRSKVIVDKFVQQNKGKFFYEFTYGDENGAFESALEHSDIFSNVPNITMSRH